MRFAALFLVLLPAGCMAGVPSLRPGPVKAQPGLLMVATEQGTPGGIARAMEQMPGIDQGQAGGACEDLQTPMPISTPAPALQAVGSHGAIRVNFVINTDGSIENPIIVLSAGSRLDRMVTRTLSRWRYRPASCDGVPIQAEASIEFPAK